MADETNRESVAKRTTDHSQYLTDSHRVEHKDKALKANIAESDWTNLQLIRLVAIKKRFTKVNFSNTAFDACYLRDCQFDSCNFTGARFSSTNLHGAKFTGCIFDYATFERTIIDDAVLTDSCPPHENQKMRFARSLRTNYQQIGDATAANHAIRVELDATEIHLRKSWKSNDHYYRTKYAGFPARAKQFASWLKFKLLDYVWGNGESISALLRAVFILIVLIAILDIATDPAFGSICRGEISPGSDIDLLAVATGGTNNLSRSMFSIYSHAKIDRIWQDGNPFAWHLHLESKFIFGSDDRDYLGALGSPATYSKARDDCERFLAIFKQAQDSSSRDSSSIVFDLSTAFLSLRNFSSCFLLGRGRPDFSRGVALGLMGDHPPVSMDAYQVLERARLLCTRGFGAVLAHRELELARRALPALRDWMTRVHEGELHGR